MKRIKPENTTTVVFEYVCESSESIEQGVFFENWVSAGELYDWNVEQTVDIDEDGDVMYYYWVEFIGFLPGKTEAEMREEINKVDRSIIPDKRCHNLCLEDVIIYLSDETNKLDNILSVV